MSRVAVVVALAAAVLAAGCSPSIGNPVRILPCTPSKDRPDKQMVRMAQSVPTASAVPCMRAELDDWFLDDLDSWNGGTRIEFSRLIDQIALTIELTRTCDRGAASEPATDQPGTRRFDERIRAGSSYRDRRFYLLPGACLAYTFGLTGTGAEAAAEDISRAIGLVGRDQLADQVRRAGRWTGELRCLLHVGIGWRELDAAGALDVLHTLDLRERLNAGRGDLSCYRPQPLQ